MSFLFKSSKQKNAPSGLPAASRDIRSADGTPPGGSSSQIPTLNGIVNGSKPGSPVPQQGTSVNNSLNSLAENPSGPGGGSRAGIGQANVRPSQDVIIEGGPGGRDMGAGPPSPEQKSIRSGNTSMDAPRQRLPAQVRPPNDPSPYPWSSRQLTFTVSAANQPFPRYGAAVNATASKDGSIYLMGGLVNGSTVKGDLWMVEAGAAAQSGPSGPPGGVSCYPVATTSEGPGPRVGHASLLVGNAFIVFGGDTKMDEGDSLDDTLYLLNTSTKQWSRALPAGPRPPGRYGHTLNILGSRIYVFGGQVEGFFFNDLVAFDLNALQQATNRWEILVQNTIDGGPPHGQIPPARTNHSVVGWGDKLWLFGGTDGVRWYNDVWSYDPRTNSWTCLECIGYIPSPREGHAAALVGDVMYIFGGRTEEGNDLGDLAAFRISTRRWYTFQNMGPSPSPRSGHSMTTVGKSVVVVGGEPSSAPRDVVELGLGYWLDTGKIRYPPDSASQQQSLSQERGLQHRRPSGDKNAIPMPAGRGQPPPQARDMGIDSPRSGSANDLRGRSESIRSESNGSKLPAPARVGPQAQLPAPTGPPPQIPSPQSQQQAQNQRGLNTNGIPHSRQPTRPGILDRALSPTSTESPSQQSYDRTGMTSPSQGQRGLPVLQENVAPSSPSFGTSNFAMPGSFSTPAATPYYDSVEQPPLTSGYTNKPETYQPSKDQEQSQSSQENVARSGSRAQRNVSTDLDRDAMAAVQEETTPKTSSEESITAPTMPKVRELVDEEGEGEGEGEKGPQDSGIGSSPALNTTQAQQSQQSQQSQQQYDDLAQELEQVKARNAWFASELALARKSGYAPRTTDSPVGDAVMDERAPDVFGDEDKPLIEALLKMKTELVRVQDTIEEQSKNAAERIAEMEKQRDAAINEAVYAKTRLAGQGSPLPEGETQQGKRSPVDQDRTNDLNRRLASSLNAQTELSRKIDGVRQEVEGERKARLLAEETAEAAQKRVSELDTYRQQHSSELESLRSELHDAQRDARDISASHAEVLGKHDLLEVDKRDVDSKLERAQTETANHSSILSSLREALTASQDRAQTVEERLEEERGFREQSESKLRQIKAEHEERTNELETTSRRLRDAEEMAEKHAEEARTHRSAVLAGLGQVAERDFDADDAADERVALLQRQVESAHAMVRQNQQAADAAEEKLRRAEERIAGLEAFQEQASREGLSIRKQLQGAMKENQNLSSQKQELEQKVQSQQLETNALSVQHASLRDILGERGINAAEVRRSRAIDSPSSLSRFSTPDLHRVKELEQQLEASLKSHDEMKAQFEKDEERKKEYEEKLTALDNDHQAAVKYLRGTEKMLSKMKQELQRVKDENRELKKRLDKAKDESESRAVPTEEREDWEQERDALKKEVGDTQAQLESSVSDLEDRLNALHSQLQSASSELQQTKLAHATTNADLNTLQTTHSQSRDDISKLQRDNSHLEERARDAENKVQLLLDQVEHSVDNYRRQSRMAGLAADGSVPTMNGTFHRPLSGLSEAPGVPAGPGGSGAAPASINHIGTGGGAPGHARSQSDGNVSIISGITDLTATDNGTVTGSDGGRNSLALDALAGELDALRSHWETTKNYRLSDRFDFERTPTAGLSSQQGGGLGMANWRLGLDVSGDDDGEGSGRPSIDESEDGDDERGMAVSTPTRSGM